MLLINTVENKAIYIDDTLFKVAAIDAGKRVCFCQYEKDQKMQNLRLLEGVPHQLEKEVSVIVVRITTGSKTIVTLGFNAPKRIKIKGEWFDEKKNRLSSRQLNMLHDKEIFHHASLYAETPLEKALVRAANECNIDY